MSSCSVQFVKKISLSVRYEEKVKFVIFSFMVKLIFGYTIKILGVADLEINVTVIVLVLEHRLLY